MNILALIREAVARHITAGGRAPTRLYLGILADREFIRELSIEIQTTEQMRATGFLQRRIYEGMQIFVVADDPEHVAVA